MSTIAGMLGLHVLTLILTLAASKLISLFLGGGTSLVVQKLTIRPRHLAETSNAVEITGRREGLVAFLLTLIGLSPTTSLNVNDRESVCTTVGLLGTENRSVPMDRVAQITSGSKVAFEYLFGAIMMAFTGVSALIGCLFNFELLAVLGIPVVTLLMIAVMIVMYRLNKRFYVGIFAQAGRPMLLAFKPNVIEGVELNLDRAMEIAAIIRDLAVRSSCEDTATKPQSTVRLAESPEAADPGVAQRGLTFASVANSNRPSELLVKVQDLIKAGKRDDAIATLQQLVRDFPSTLEAEQARRSLARAGISTTPPRT